MFIPLEYNSRPVHIENRDFLNINSRNAAVLLGFVLYLRAPPESVFLRFMDAKFCNCLCNLTSHKHNLESFFTGNRVGSGCRQWIVAMDDAGGSEKLST